MKKRNVLIGLLALMFLLSSFSVLGSAKEKVEMQKGESENIHYTIPEEDDVIKGADVEQSYSWSFDGIKTDLKSPQQENVDAIEIEPQISGNIDGLKYKYVWMKDGWKKWGVIKQFSEAKCVLWEPKETGKYTLYVDVCGKDGNIITKKIEYSIVPVQWKYNSIDFSPEEAQTPMTDIKATVNISGNRKDLQYKIVWMKNGWETWGVAQNFSEKNSVVLSLKEPGDYKIYVDIKDWKGNITTYISDYKIMTHVWQYAGISTDLPSPQEKYTVPIKVKADVTGDTQGVKYKFVWEKEGWKKWGVIQNFSEKNSAAWNPREVGSYNLYVDVKDSDGRIITKHISFEITKVNWSYTDIQTNPVECQKKGENVTIKPIAEGNTKGLQYKYVWMRDNWKEWGVIKQFSNDEECVWKTPKKAGNYTVYVDVKDRDGEIRTRSIEFFVASQIWQYEGIDVNSNVSEQVYTEIPLTAQVSGEIKNLEYKFVWMKDNWDEWGIVQDFSKKSSAVWYPKEPGNYKIYCDVKDIDGRMKTLIQEYKVNDAPWSVKEIKQNGAGSYYVGDTTTVTVVTEGKTEGLKYKIVQKNGEDWSDWKVLKKLDEKNSAKVKLNKEGNTYIYIDIMDQRGVVFDPVILKISAHSYSSAGASSQKISLGKAVSLYPNITGGTPNGMQCKYVWMKDNWNSWGVIRDFSGTSSISWTPSSPGTYYVYIDVKLNNTIRTKTTKIVVENVKNGWYYENGYKFYYIDGIKQLDLDGIIPKQSSYYIKVNRTTCSVTVYAKDGANGYIIPVKRFACSVGLPSTPTPKGTYYTQNKYRWRTLIGPSYGQYCTRIVGGILFHSVAGRNMTSYNLNARDFNKLGSPASHGCVRLCVRDAKWIYDNCSLGTKVTIYDSSDPGPFGKPDTIKIPSWQTWDPTDPNI